MLPNWITRITGLRTESSRRNRRRRRARRSILCVHKLEDRVTPATLTVTGTGDTVAADGLVTLREAILSANADTDQNADVAASRTGGYGADTITFAIGSGPQTIAPLSALPTITDPVVIDGTTQPGFAGIPAIELNGSTAGADVSGLTIMAAGSTIKGLVINRFAGSGVLIIGASATGNTVAGNYIGTNGSGDGPLGNKYGVQTADGATDTVIGTNGDGTNDAAERNILSGNTSLGVRIDGAGTVNTAVAGNYIGLSANGEFAIGNGIHGVQIANGAKGVRIGTNGDGVADVLERNVISGNGFQGVLISGVEQVWVAGNYVGLNAGGSFRIPNGFSGVRIAAGGKNNVVGTNGDGLHDDIERNVISGNTQWGVFISDVGSDNNVVAGNYIGTNATGDTAVLNVYFWDGVSISGGARKNRIGTNGDGVADAAERNVISGNRNDGVLLAEPGTENNVVAGNYIGLNAAGTAQLGNGNSGVRIELGAQNNRIGTNADGVADAAERNVISGDGTAGVRIWDAGTSGNVVAGNYIGTNAAGTAAVPNASRAVRIMRGATGNVIGGSVAAARNVISGNGDSGVWIVDPGTSGNVVAGNYIGTDASGTAALGNGVGVTIEGGATNNTVGGGTLGVRNVISGNLQAGVNIVGWGTTGNVVAGNYVGTNAAGTAAVANGNTGVVIQLGASDNRIGTDGDGVGDTAERNVISGSQSQGVLLTGVGTDNNIIAGNYIGTNATGTAAVPTPGAGVVINGAARNNRVGTDANGIADAAERNVISGNTIGLSIWGGTNGNVVAGNYIGTNAAGTAAVPNGTGIGVYGLATRIGGGAPGAGNLISGNNGAGIDISGASATVVAGNLIGLNAAGTAALPNGVGMFNNGAADTRIGTDGDGVNDVAERNVISGNTGGAVYIINAAARTVFEVPHGSWTRS